MAQMIQKSAYEPPKTVQAMNLSPTSMLIGVFFSTYTLLLLLLLLL